jgi:hypothetical protein
MTLAIGASSDLFTNLSGELNTTVVACGYETVSGTYRFLPRSAERYCAISRQVRTTESRLRSARRSFLGRMLRESRMAASVGESYPEGCKARTASDESCRRIMQANRELKAQLRTAGAVCYSACVYALLGASARNVPANARVGIHASAPSAVSPRPGPFTAEQLLTNRKRHVLEMGANPALQDAAMKTPPPSVHVLNRAELIRYRVQASAPYESDWMQYQEPRGLTRTYTLKSVSEARGANGTEFRTTNLRLTCAEGRPAASIEYQRELTLEEARDIAARWERQQEQWEEQADPNSWDNAVAAHYRHLGASDVVRLWGAGVNEKGEAADPFRAGCAH